MLPFKLLSLISCEKTHNVLQYGLSVLSWGCETYKQELVMGVL